MDEMNSTPSTLNYMWVVYKLWGSGSADTGTWSGLPAQPGLIC